jgi:hypothetical protein
MDRTKNSGAKGTGQMKISTPTSPKISNRVESGIASDTSKANAHVALELGAVSHARAAPPPHSEEFAGWSWDAAEEASPTPNKPVSSAQSDEYAGWSWNAGEDSADAREPSGVIQDQELVPDIAPESPEEIAQRRHQFTVSTLMRKWQAVASALHNTNTSSSSSSLLASDLVRGLDEFLKVDQHRIHHLKDLLKITCGENNVEVLRSAVEFLFSCRHQRPLELEGKSPESIVKFWNNLHAFFGSILSFTSGATLYSPARQKKFPGVKQAGLSSSAPDSTRAAPALPKTRAKPVLQDWEKSLRELADLFNKAR